MKNKNHSSLCATLRALCGEKKKIKPQSNTKDITKDSK